MPLTLTRVIAAVLIIATTTYAADPRGLSVIERFDLLPQIRYGVQAYSTSSHDPTGSNSDHDYYLDAAQAEKVLLDVKGPGCVYRIWFTAKNWDTRGIIRIYFDGSTTPTVEMTLTEFFGGTVSPFLAPLVGNYLSSSGGYYSYVPMSFVAGCRITSTNAATMNYFNVWYHRFATAEGITTFNGTTDVSQAVSTWQNAGSDPKADTGSVGVSNTTSVAASSSVTLAEVNSPGTIAGIELNIPGMSDVQARQLVDDGRSFKGCSQFQVAIDPANRGVRLVRRLYYRTPNQLGNVYVDGTLVGQWFTPDGLTGTWLDASFWIPPSLTAGKSAITVKCEYVSSDYDWWNEFYYWVYSLVGPQQVLTDQLDVGNTASEAGHIYSFTHTDPTYPATLTTFHLHYNNPASPVRFTDDGRSFNNVGVGKSEFRLAIDPNNQGCSLTRRFYYNGVSQSATAYVQDATGSWVSIGNVYSSNPGSDRWADSSIEIPSSLTTGRSELKIRLQYSTSISAAFSEYYYWMYSLVGGQRVLTDELDVGKSDAEAFHGYTITNQFWSGTTKTRYDTPVFDNYQALLASLRLRITWDDAGAPAVYAPLGLFFGSGQGPAPVRSLPVGIDGDRLYCYFPMPFASRALVELRNNGATTVQNIGYTIRYTPRATPQSDVGRFCAAYRFEFPTTAGRDYTFLDETGIGHLVGVVQSSRESRDKKLYLEGDERIYVDGNLTPAIYGTGTEDFYNAGWYFAQGIFTRPLHGSPFEQDLSTNSVTCYRFFLGDVIPFTQSIHVGIEHGGANDEVTSTESVAFYYKLPDPLSRITDQIDVGDSGSESAHSYITYGSTAPASKTTSYEGDGDDINIADAGRQIAIRGSVRFRATIAPGNNGVILRRRLDYSVPRQQAAVFVDNVEVGTWYDAGGNTSHSWRDSDFLVPAVLTHGKSSIEVTLVNVSPESVWTEYHYRIQSCAVPKTSRLDFDADGDVDQEDFGRMQLCLSGPFIPQTDPTCEEMKVDADSDVDIDDLTDFMTCFTAPNAPADPRCGG
jgi:hypothetical protein